MSTVLIVTGGLLSVQERSLRQALSRQVASFRAAEGGWLDLRMKALVAGHLAQQQAFLRSRAFRTATYRPAVERFMAEGSCFETPELTEVVLMTLLAREGIAYEATTWSELHADAALRERLLRKCEVVFASTTLIRDSSELTPLLALVSRPHNKVVCGGALASLLHAGFEGCDGLDVLAVGYGERLVPALAAWIRGGFARLEAPPGGRLVRAGRTDVLFSGVPASLDLDDLPTPDWTLAERYHGRRFRMVHYESVRGCPYRCAFCNYPYLFDDTKFRYKSAARIAADWAHYAARGVEYVTALDSLFTMPKRRLVALCERLLADGTRIKWICYARADDLDDPALCALMKRAGCHQVQIGIESGSQQQLDHMAKRCTVEAGAAALANCERTGLTTLVSLIVGFPGETQRTLADTLAFLRATRPDFCYVSPFMTRIESVPVLSPDSRARFGLVTAGGLRSSAPYWRHATMCASEVPAWWTWLVQRMTDERLALDGGLFYRGILHYDRRDRPALLDFQRDFMRARGPVPALLAPLHRFLQARLERDLTRVLGPRAAA